MRFAIFISIVTAVLGLATLYVGHRFFLRSVWFSHHRIALWIGLSLFLVSQIAAPLLLRGFPDIPRMTTPIHWMTSTTLGVFTTLFFYTAMAEVVLFLVNLIDFADPIDFERRSFFTIALLTLGSSAMGLREALAGP